MLQSIRNIVGDRDAIRHSSTTIRWLISPLINPLITEKKQRPTVTVERKGADGSRIEVGGDAWCHCTQ